MKKLRMLSILALIFCVFLAPLTSYNAFAVEFNKDVELLQSNFSSQVATDHWNSISCVTSPASMVYANELSCKSGILRLYSLYTKIPNRQYNSGDWIVINLQYWVSTQSSGQYNSIFTGIKYGGNNKVDLVDYEVSTASDSSTNVKLYLRVYGTFTDSDLKFVGAQGSNGIIDLVGTSTSPEIGGFIRATGVSVWREKTAKDFSSQIESINNSMDEMITLQESTKESIEQQSQIQQQEYDKTVQDEANASSGANGFSFNFTLPNPFEVFRVGDGCVSTPTVDSWLGLATNSNHCPIFPQSIRNTLTPVVTLFVSLATLMVVIRWVSGTTADISDMRVAQSNAKIAAERSEYYKSKKGGK